LRLAGELREAKRDSALRHRGEVADPWGGRGGHGRRVGQGTEEGLEDVDDWGLVEELQEGGVGEDR
jgi:hypothetical protein